MIDDDDDDGKLDAPSEDDHHWDWTVTLGELRKLDLPDETQVIVYVEQFEFLEANIEYKFPAVLDHPPALVIGGGQQINHELDMIDRLDAYLGILGKE